MSSLSFPRIPLSSSHDISDVQPLVLNEKLVAREMDGVLGSGLATGKVTARCIPKLSAGARG